MGGKWKKKNIFKCTKRKKRESKGQRKPFWLTNVACSWIPCHCALLFCQLLLQVSLSPLVLFTHSNSAVFLLRFPWGPLLPLPFLSSDCQVRWPPQGLQLYLLQLFLYHPRRQNIWVCSFLPGSLGTWCDLQQESLYLMVCLIVSC